MTLSERLAQPYPLITFDESIKRNIFFSIFLTLFLLIFRPFGLEVYGYEESYLIAGYGVVTFLSILLTDYISTHFFRDIFNEEKWKVYKQAVYTIIVLLFLGITNYIYAYLIDAFPGTVIGFLKVQLYVFLSCIIPVILVLLWRQNHLLKKNIFEAQQLTLDLSAKVKEPISPDENATQNKITFTGENKGDEICIFSDHLICVISKENYVEIVWQQRDTVRKSLLRGTLTRVEENLAGFKNVFRSHRSYLVNLKKVQSVEGNAQGYRLVMESLSETIPVARGRGVALHDALNSGQTAGS